MSDIAKLKIELNPVGRGTVTLNGVDISNCVKRIEFAAAAGEKTEVSLSIFAEVDAEIAAFVERIALAKPEASDAQVIRTADGRVLNIPPGAK